MSRGVETQESRRRGALPKTFGPFPVLPPVRLQVRDPEHGQDQGRRDHRNLCHCLHQVTVLKNGSALLATITKLAICGAGVEVQLESKIHFLLIFLLTVFVISDTFCNSRRAESLEFVDFFFFIHWIRIATALC